MSCFCDYDPATFYNRVEHTARKEHKCSECFRLIAPGERYEYVFGVWDGQGDTFKTCLRCLDLRRFVEEHVPCLCWAHGNTIEDCVETARGYAHETVGLWFGTLRRKVLIERNQRSPDGGWRVE